MIEIDGSFGEGGGQIIRTALTLSALTGKPVTIENVRARRTRPGLQRQHLTAVHAAAALCEARVGCPLGGAAVQSTAFSFTPRGRASARPWLFEIGTAGASTLVAQTVLLPLALRGEAARATVTGGTHVPHSPPAEYLEAVYLPALRRAGLDAASTHAAAGFFPRGGGRLELDIGEGAALRSFDFTERGRLLSLRAFVVTAGLPPHVGERGERAVERFMKGVGRPVSVERRELSSPGAGAAVVLAAECEGGFAGFSGLGEIGKPMERVAEEPCQEFMAWWKCGAACDAHLADQLVLPAALASGESRWTTPAVTEHLTTVLWLVRHFLPIRHELELLPGGTHRVTLRSPGLPG